MSLNTVLAALTVANFFIGSCLSSTLLANSFAAGVSAFEDTVEPFTGTLHVEWGVCWHRNCSREDHTQVVPGVVASFSSLDKKRAATLPSDSPCLAICAAVTGMVKKQKLDWCNVTV